MHATVCSNVVICVLFVPSHIDQPIFTRLPVTDADHNAVDTLVVGSLVVVEVFKQNHKVIQAATQRLSLY